MKADTVIFDLDGTLVDSAADLTASLNHALWVLGRPPVDPADVRGLVGLGARRLIAYGLSFDGNEASADMVESGVHPFMDHYRANIAAHTRPFPGVEDVLDALRSDGLRLAICTNKPASLAEDLIDRLGWGGRFDSLLGADSRPFRKPDPRHLFETLNAAGGSRAIFVGDSRTDAETAIAAAVPLILVSFGYSMEPVSTLGADHVIDHFNDLRPAIHAIQRQFTASGAPEAA